MFRWLGSRLFWGAILIIGGALLLVENLGYVRLGELFWGLAFALGGLMFLTVYLENRVHWWAFIPGLTLLSISLIIFIHRFFPALSSSLGGLIVLGGIGLSFLFVYMVDRSNWWALIPMGVMFTLAVVSVLPERIGFISTGGLFFLGMGGTFALVALLPTQQGKMRWAWIPAGILVLMGLLITAAEGQLIVYIGPLLLIVAGLYLLFKTFRRG